MLFVYNKTCSFFKPLAPKLSSAFFGQTKATALSWARLVQQTDVRQEITGNSKGVRRQATVSIDSLNRSFNGSAASPAPGRSSARSESPHRDGDYQRRATFVPFATTPTSFVGGVQKNRIFKPELRNLPGSEQSSFLGFGLPSGGASCACVARGWVHCCPARIGGNILTNFM